jgi:myo-inositol-1(or 4)-monophosphatase
MKNSELKKILSLAVKASKEGGRVAMKYFKRLKKIDIKEGAGLVSEADKESEEVIQEIIHKKYPKHRFLGEESWSATIAGGAWPSSHDGLWVVDPIDGTTNYIHGFPMFCVSIGFEYKEEMLVGVVHAPLLIYTFTAVKGGGAFWNGKPIKVSQTEKLDDSLLATGFSYMRNEVLEEELRRFKTFAEKTRGLRRAGSAALDLCFVAAGVFDGFWERELAPWDTAAGSLIVREAGGVVTDFSGAHFHYPMRSIVAGNPKIAEAIKLGIRTAPKL